MKLLIISCLLATSLGRPAPASCQPLSQNLFDIKVDERVDQYDIFLINKVSFDITVDLSMELVNLKSSTELPLTMSLKGFQETKALQLKVIKKYKQGSYKSAYRYTIGNVCAKHDTSYIYHLPYKVGSARRVVQSYFGDISHNESSKYAVDFEMPTGTAVYAARDGIVVGFYEGSNRGGTHADFMKLTNYIFIRHQDFTIGAYYHLKRNGALVRIGQKVKRGEHIGYSGQTGYTLGAHLHFEVFKALNGKEQITFPLKFATLKGVISNPIEGQSYIAK